MLESPLHIALVGPARFGVGEPFAGGLEAHTTTTARALTRLGHRVTVFAGPADAATPPDLDVVPIVDGDGDLTACERLDIAMPRAAVLDTARNYARVMDHIDLSDAFDIVHNNSLHPIPVDRGGNHRTPTVHHLHCPPFAALADAHQRRADRLGNAAPLDVVAVSESLARQWSGLAGNVVWNGIDTETWTPSASGRPSDRCVWVGRIVSEKAPHLAIDAARHAGRPIVLAGPIQEPRYFDEMVVPRLGPQARYAGHLDNAALVSLVSSSAVGVVTPCWDEPFGLVVAEMLACGTPVAALDRGAMSELLRPTVGVLSRSDDDSALADAIERASSLSRRTCRRHAVNHLSVDRMAAAYVRNYRRAIDDSIHALAV